MEYKITKYDTLTSKQILINHFANKLKQNNYDIDTLEYVENYFDNATQKQIILASQLDGSIRQINKSIFIHNQEQIQGVEYNKAYTLNYDSAMVGQAIIQNVAPNMFKLASNLNHNKYKRKVKLNHYISNMFEYGNAKDKLVIFGTFTFDNEKLAHTSPITRRRYVARALKTITNNGYYIANIDFGDKTKNENSNEREHYHAIFILDKSKVMLKNRRYLFKDSNVWTCGFYNLKLCCTDSEKSSDKLAKYITKLTNHGIKESAKSIRLIYGKTIKEIVYQNKVRQVKEQEHISEIEQDLGLDIQIEW